MIALVFYGLALSAYGGTGHPPYAVASVEGNRSIAPEEVVRILENHFQQIYPEGRYRIEVKDLRLYEKMVLPAGQFFCQVILPESSQRGGMVATSLRFPPVERKSDPFELRPGWVSMRMWLWPDTT